MNWDMLIFAYLAFAIVTTSLWAILCRNPVHTVLLILVMIIHQAFLILTLGCEFLTAVQIIVYAGAIMVLFLFVVYLVNLRKETRSSMFIRKWALALIGILFFAFFFWLNINVLIKFNPQVKAYLPFNSSKSVLWWMSSYLFKYYLLQFEIVGTILLVAVLGSVFLLRKVKALEDRG
ncbi:MAG: NADH-ubiquinone/plastoquinone oxidoreductase chain 6 [Thermodesulfobacteria bacterium]|nr:NADH-ubiquinone/plastoquinone oxidoreductase chain 6 [Thermodesulfobacteriota bacterium]